MLQLSPQDSQFVFMDNDNNLSNVVMASIYAPPENLTTSIFQMVKDHVESRLHTSAIFTRKLVRVPLDLDFPYWAEDKYFDLDGHIHLHQFPAPGDWQQFSDLMGRVHSRPLDMKRPVWEMHVVENLSGIKHLPKGSFAVLTKMHHAAVDGAAMFKFFSCLSDIDAKGTPAADISEIAEKAGPVPSTEEIWKGVVINNVRSPLRLSKILLQALPTAVPALLKPKNKDAEEAKSKVPTTILNKPVSPHKIFDAVDFSLADFKAIQKLVDGAKINDVFLAACSGAMHNYLQAHKGLPKESLVAFVPINTRKSGAEASSDSGNQITAMATQLFTQLKDPVQRLAAITDETQLSKTAQEGVSAKVMADVTKNMPGATMALASRLFVDSGLASKLFNVAISNVPGPQVPLYMNGAKCLHQYGMTPLGEGMGLFFVALSYNGTISITLTSTKEIIPDMPVLKQCLQDAVAELVAATKPNKPSNPRTKVARKKTAKISPIKKST